MKLNKSAKIIVGVGTLFVAAFPFLFMVIFFLPIFLAGFGRGEEPSPAFVGAFFLIFPLMLLFSLLQMGLMIFYVVHVIKNSTASEAIRILLGVGIYFMPYIAMPTYYLVYVLPDTPPEWAQQQKTGRIARRGK